MTEIRTPAPAAVLPSPTRYALAAIRIVIGYMWFTQTQWKMPPDWGCGPSGDRGLCDWIQREINSPLIPAYRDFLAGFVQPNLGWLGAFIYATELVIAISLIFGLFVRIGALIATAQSLNLLIGLWNVPNEWYWTYVFLACINFVFFLTNAGRTFGLDALIMPRLEPNVPRALRWLF